MDLPVPLPPSRATNSPCRTVIWRPRTISGPFSSYLNHTSSAASTTSPQGGISSGRQGPGGVIREPHRQEGSALRTVTGQEASLCTEAQIRMAEGMARKHPVPLLPQPSRPPPPVCRYTAAVRPVHHRRMGCQWQSLFQPMLRQKDGGPQLPVDAAPASGGSPRRQWGLTGWWARPKSAHGAASPSPRPDSAAASVRRTAP